MSIRQRLTLLILLSALAIIALGAIVFLQFQRNSQSLADFINRTLPAIQGMSEVESDIKSIQLFATTFVYDSDTSLYQQQLQALPTHMQSAEAKLQNQLPLASSETQQKLIAQLQAKLQAYFEAVNQAIGFRQADKRSLAMADFGANASILLEEFQQAVTTLNIEHERSRKAYEDSLQLSSKQNTRTLIAALALVVAFLLALGIWLYRSIVRPLQAMEATMNSVASSLDFTQRAPVLRPDEIGNSVLAFNSLIEHIHSALTNIRTIIKRNHLASKEMHQSAIMLGHTAQQGHSASGAIHTAVTDIGKLISEIAAGTNQAVDLTVKSGAEATANSQTIQSTVERASALSDSVGQAADRVYALAEAGNNISIVVDEIRKIAEQTNLLALNAAIEAARAGESGRGFSVVADEVRKLAEGVSNSTKSISERIKEIQNTSVASTNLMRGVVQDMQANMAMTQNAGQAMNHVEGYARSVVGTVEQIRQLVVATQNASGEISNQVFNISELIDNANKAATHTKNSAESIRDISQEMSDIVGRFRLEA